MQKNKMNCSIDTYLEEYRKILDKMVGGMTEAELNCSISHNFIVQMIPHHKAAIEMSENILKYTENKDLKNIAENIILEQTESIKNMQKIECSCSKLINTCQQIKLYQRNVDQILKVMFSEMNQAYSGKRLNCDFMREMIPHHEGAIKMSKNALRFRICPELKPILESIINSQEKGICEMKNLLTSLNCRN